MIRVMCTKTCNPNTAFTLAAPPCFVCPQPAP